jgi:hypothetical protein
MRAAVRRLTLDVLEYRDVPSATLSGGILTIDCDWMHDTVTVSVSGSNIHVNHSRYNGSDLILHPIYPDSAPRP